MASIRDEIPAEMIIWSLLAQLLTVVKLLHFATVTGLSNLAVSVSI